MAGWARDEYKHGDYNVICERSGFKVKRSECRETWDGYLVHKDFWEPRHPQDRVRSVGADRQTVENARPDNVNRFVSSVSDETLTGTVTETVSAGETFLSRGSVTADSLGNVEADITGYGLQDGGYLLRQDGSYFLLQDS